MLNKFKDKYKFDSEGNVYSKYSTGRVPKLLDTPKVMKSQLDKEGYVRYTLRDNNKKQYTVFKHRITMCINNIIPLSETYTHINHIDGNKENNNLDNLEFCTPSHNSKHRFDVLKQVNHNRMFTNSEIKTIRKEYQPFVKGKGIDSLAKKWNCSYSVMRNIVQLTTYKH